MEIPDELVIQLTQVTPTSCGLAEGASPDVFDHGRVRHRGDLHSLLGQAVEQHPAVP